MSYLIEAKQLTKIYGDVNTQRPVLNNVSLNLARGERIAIMGPSGAGKSTLMHLLGLLDTPTYGTLTLDGHTIDTASDNMLAHLRNTYIGFVFQQFMLLPRFTALQNVCLPQLYRTDRRVDEAHALNMLKLVNMDAYAHKRPTELSGGQQQRVAIARALVNTPDILLADEPTGALDQKTGAEVMQLFKTLNETQGVTVIVITHDAAVAAQCQRVLHIKDGCLQCD